MKIVSIKEERFSFREANAPKGRLVELSIHVDQELFSRLMELSGKRNVSFLGIVQRGDLMSKIVQDCASNGWALLYTIPAQVQGAGIVPREGSQVVFSLAGIYAPFTADFEEKKDGGCIFIIRGMEKDVEIFCQEDFGKRAALSISSFLAMAEFPEGAWLVSKSGEMIRRCKKVDLSHWEEESLSWILG